MQFRTLGNSIKLKLKAMRIVRPSWKQVGIIGGVVVGFLVIVNLAMAWFYQNHYYPTLKAGEVKVGNLTPARARQVLADRVDRQPLVLSFQDKVVKVSTADLGVSYDLDQTIAQLNQHSKPAIPMMIWLSNPDNTQYPLQYRIVDEEKFTRVLQSYVEKYTSQPQDAQLKIADGQAKIANHRIGAEYSFATVQKDVEAGLSMLSSQPHVVSFKEIPVKVSADDLKSALEQANQKLGRQIKLSYNQKQYSPSRAEIGSWLKMDDTSVLTLNESEVAEYIEQVAEEIDIAAKNEVITTLDGVETSRQPGQSGLSLNRTDTTQAILQALKKNQNLNYDLKTSTVEPTAEYIRKFSYRALTYNYCIAANSVSADLLNHFSQKIASTFADQRGWGLGGKINFQEVSSGCSFSLVLAAASTLPSYSSVCSTYYSCRAGSNVIINVDRWTGASDSWNQAGGTLDEYQSMVINHEVGHWLGFYDNQWVCQGPGQKAPLMQQQSIDLRGCTFNAWPTTAELNALQSLKGI